MIRRRSIATACAGIILTTAPASAANRPQTVEEFMEIGSPVRVVAHRGFSARAPENTMAAIREAIAIGADMVEVDVSATADGTVVCIHDDTLDRTTDGRGPVAARTMAEILELDAGSWFDPDFAGEKIPTLARVLAETDGRILLNVEIKPEAVELGVAEAVAAMIAARSMHDRVVVSSFAPEALLRLRLADPEIVRISLYNKELHQGMDPLEITTQVGARGLNISRKRVTAEIVARCHGRRIPVGVYTANEPAIMARLLEMGVHTIFTDHPDRLLDLRDSTTGDQPPAAAGLSLAR